MLLRGLMGVPLGIGLVGAVYFFLGLVGGYVGVRDLEIGSWVVWVFSWFEWDLEACVWVLGCMCMAVENGLGIEF